MATVFDYIKKYNVSFIEKEFNEVDNIIFSRFVYVIFDEVLANKEKLSLKDLYKKYKDINPYFHDKKTLKLFEEMSFSNRYKDLFVGNYLSITSNELEKQFAAITIYLPDDSIYISFRGTDSSLVGIKEDFNMSYMSHVPSQIDSVKYLEDVAKNNNYKIRVGGHSKGGNMAMYASIFCKEEYKPRIIEIYNNDGPGFFSEIINTQKYQEIVDKTFSYIPQTSIIGMLLYHKEKVNIVKSNKTFITQHDLLTWEIKDDKLVTLEENDKKSKYIDNIMSEFILLPKEERQEFFEIMYQLITINGATTVRDLSNQKIKSAKEMLAKYKKLNEDEKKLFIKIWKEIIKIAKSNIRNYLPKIKKEK